MTASDALLPAARPSMVLDSARALLAQNTISDKVALIGVRGFFASMGATQQNDPGVYDDAIFLMTEAACTGFNANTDPSRYEAPNVTLKAGTWRYRIGKHKGYDALVESGLPGDEVLVVAHPRKIDDYHLFTHTPGVDLDHELGSVQAYWAALELKGARRVPSDNPEWPDIEYKMPRLINIHRGASDSTSSKGCQTVPPAQWQEFITSVKAALHDHKQELVTYLLLEGPLPSQ
jgi:hypothetical protein